MQAFYVENLILIVNFPKSGQIRANPDKIGEEIPRRKMHALKIPQHLEPQGFEVCERGKNQRIPSYYIHHFNSTKARKKVGIIYPPTKKKGGYNIPTGRTAPRV